MLVRDWRPRERLLRDDEAADVTGTVRSGKIHVYFQRDLQSESIVQWQQKVERLHVQQPSDRRPFAHQERQD